MPVPALGLALSKIYTSSLAVCSILKSKSMFLKSLAACRTCPVLLFF